MIKITATQLIIDEVIKPKSGVYKLIAFDKNGEIIPLNRFLGQDIKGVLYIGKSINLQKRVAKLRRGLLNSNESIGHIASRRMKSINNIRKYIDFTTLRLSIEYTDCNESAVELEKLLLNKYTDEFCVFV